MVEHGRPDRGRRCPILWRAAVGMNKRIDARLEVRRRRSNRRRRCRCADEDLTREDVERVTLNRILLYVEEIVAVRVSFRESHVYTVLKRL